MLGTVVWALLTGLITGGVWVAILLVRHQRQLTQLDPELLHDLQSRVTELEEVGGRLGEVEGRLDFAERLLMQERQAPRVPAPAAKGTPAVDP
jgi:hypothetical protein